MRMLRKESAVEIRSVQAFNINVVNPQPKFGRLWDEYPQCSHFGLLSFVDLKIIAINYQIG